MESSLILEMRNINKSFPGVQALKDAQLIVKRGQIHALMGENGAGKSTLMNVLLGAIARDSGTISFDGQEVNFRHPMDALNAGISMIHQEISLVPTMDVSENVWLGREPVFAKRGLLSIRDRQLATEKLLKRLGIDLNPRAVVKTLSVAAMQLVEIARAVSYDAKVIVMDEPTSSLTEREIRLLYRIIRDLATQGTAVIFISHKLDEVYEICDHITVMRDGAYIMDAPSGTLSQDALIGHIAGRTIDQLFPKAEAEIGEVILEVENLSSGRVFQDINFTVRRGEIVGFSGLVGAGRTEVMRALFGIDKHDGGTIKLKGNTVALKTPQQAIQAGLGMVTEDRLLTGVVRNLPVLFNMSMANLRNITNKLGHLLFKKELNDANKMVSQFSIKLSNIKQPIGSLSGGNQQKVIISRWLLTSPDVLILDEPTRGVDVGSKSEIHRIIGLLAQQGLAVILVSSELPELMGMCDRIYVMRQGRIVSEVSKTQATQELLIKHAFGV